MHKQACRLVKTGTCLETCMHKEASCLVYTGRYLERYMHMSGDIDADAHVSRHACTTSQYQKDLLVHMCETSTHTDHKQPSGQ